MGRLRIKIPKLLQTPLFFIGVLFFITSGLYSVFLGLRVQFRENVTPNLTGEFLGASRGSPHSRTRSWCSHDRLLDLPEFLAPFVVCLGKIRVDKQSFTLLGTPKAFREISPGQAVSVIVVPDVILFNAFLESDREVSVRLFRVGLIQIILGVLAIVLEVWYRRKFRYSM